MALDNGHEEERQQERLAVVVVVGVVDDFLGFFFYPSRNDSMGVSPLPHERSTVDREIGSQKSDYNDAV